MVTIRIVSWIHFLWGSTMIYLDYVPRPFGSLEPFLNYMLVRELGLLLCGTALLAMIPNSFPRAFARWPWFVPLAAVPQQLALLWGVIWALIVISIGVRSGVDSKELIRTWYGCSYQTILAVFHAVGLFGVYKAAIIEVEAQHGRRHTT